ncbi:carbamoyl phosphate synthase large subunit [Salimicrobium halophilum]|uniref:Carbamoyl-phosphate synthase large subunit n=1 Tax=Salimicrobium halophilum TaxID=86666 RepID=A0A1G8SXD4_9BACI|nr:carbamoyl phosphate synthase large subunit [Salimicrobium halophilum]SDJ33942.1 carbamoyl-phosphate synthase large subunit [Salimicrobium halophilum]
MPEKVLVIGSGPIIIGQAAEFDYSGTQGCLALKEEGLEVVLINNNPATIMTDPEIADSVYCEPLTVESIETIIQQEKPDALLAGLGGQTALNLAVELKEAGVLNKYGVKVLGTSIDSIQQGEDREQFRQVMQETDQPVVESEVITDFEHAKAFASHTGFPVISRPAYTLGGRGGGIAHDEEELETLMKDGLKASPISQVILEKSIAGFKEVEYEVMRDKDGTCISVCNMENVDPVGVHTGDSIVTAPSQTLTDNEYQMLRTAALEIVNSLNVIGGCNVQFALDPKSKQYYIIEVNPRVSRSSALASKATGYPIAKMAAKLALGYRLDELMNPLTGYTYASFEPTLDYVVVKFPRWPFDKFKGANRTLGTKMKATGEVMAIERTLEAAFMKAIDSLDQTLPTFDEETTWEHIKAPTDARFFAVLDLMRQGTSQEEIFRATGFDPFFLNVFQNMLSWEKKLSEDTSPATVKEAKLHGVSDAKLAEITGTPEKDWIGFRNKYEIAPSYKIVDTCAGEFEAETNYVYSTYAGNTEIKPLEAERKALIIGAGPIRIGQGVEFDYSAVKAIESLQSQGYTTIMINNNPETVSTDYETADRLYFEPLKLENILDVAAFEQVDIVFTAFGGQTALNVTEEIENHGYKVAGVPAKVIASLEDREAFYDLLQEIDVPHVPGEMCHSADEARQAADSYQYPLLCRPSYVIGGQGMVVIHSKDELEAALEETEAKHYPLVMDQFITGNEVEVELVSNGKDVFIPGLMAHIEAAGVHSGDSMAVFPAQVKPDVQEKVETYAEQIATHVNYKGIMNIQFLVNGDDVYVLEVNPRSSRTVPIVSKTAAVPLIDWAVRAMVDETSELPSVKPDIPYTAVKFPVFSSHALAELDHKLGANMMSTGEGMYLGKTTEQALAKVFEHLPHPDSAACFHEGKDDDFAKWLSSKEAAVYHNEEDTAEAKQKRVEALKAGITIFSNEATYQAYKESIGYRNKERIALVQPKGNEVMI